MRRLMLILILLVALFTFIRAYTDEMAAQRAAAAPTGDSSMESLRPGV